jgi:hypothetical protein
MLGVKPKHDDLKACHHPSGSTGFHNTHEKGGYGPVKPAHDDDKEVRTVEMIGKRSRPSGV